MRTRILGTTACVALLCLALTLGACNSGPGKNNTSPGQPGSGEKAPAAGTTYLNGSLVLEAITMPAAAGQPVTVVLKNSSGQDLEDLTARLILFTPATDRFSEYSTEAIDDVFKVYMNDSHTLSVVPSTSGELLRVELLVDSGQGALRPTTAREGQIPGTRLLGGLLECVAVDDRLTFEHPTITFTVENVSREQIDMFEYQVVLRKRGVVIAETAWLFVDQPVTPGRKTALEADLAGNDVGAAEAILRVRRPEL